MRRAGLILLLLLGACAAPMPEPPLSYPPSARERMLRIARAEWQDWGAQVRDAWAPPPASRPEGEAANFPRVLAYWRAVHWDEDAVRDNRPLYRAALSGEAGGERLWSDPPWSAAFIAYVMRSAGVDAREFLPDATHAFYLDALIADAQTFPAQAPFPPHAPEERAPEPGDLVCLDRSRAPLTHWRERLAETGRMRPMHCDIVVGTALGVVEAIGGNVQDSVVLTRFPAGPDGRLLPSPAGQPRLILVMENRLGRLPPWR